MPIHPNTRTAVSKLAIPSPIKKYFLDEEWEIDLSNNTNPYSEKFSEYPDVHQYNLKNLYLSRISPLSVSADPSSQQYPPLTPDNILFTVGSMEGIDILLKTFCEPNKDTICILHPAFSAYEHWGLIHNLEVKNIPLVGENLNSFSLADVVKINPKMIWVCNPNNPTSTMLKRDVIEQLCVSIDGFVVVDEAYIEFTDQPSSLAYLNKYKNLIILRTFSKAWGLAGVRCGIIIADPLVIHTLRYVQLPYGVSSPTQELVNQCLSHPEKTFESWQRIKKERENMMDALSTLGAVERVFKSETNFILVVLKDSRRVIKLLKEHRIKVLDCSTSIPSSIRVSVGTEDENRKFMEVMRKASGL
ncbi:MAG: aminotransferase class I/II-fold pyridoxal phosphate-dependent enzyme [Alphaproteobacteria bacterium]|nr:aminotransferase class I/II-fold pyridoxal phosphate-dependent enzyme [Alphaproteobacteria bacterium]